MKKTLLSIITLLMLVWIGCKKNELDQKSRNDLELIENAKVWYNGQLESFKESKKTFRVPTRALPLWDSCIVKQTAGDEYSIFVKTQGRHLSSVTVGILSSLVFSYKDGKIVSGNLVEVIGKSTFIKEKELDFAMQYKDGEIEGFDRGSFIVSDLKCKVRAVYTIVDGRLDLNTKSFIRKSQNDTLGVVSYNGKKMALLSDKKQKKLKTLDSCDAVYWVTWNVATGQIISAEFLYWACEGDDGGIEDPGGDGSGDGDGGEEVIDLPPDIPPVVLKDPCVEKAFVNKMQANATIAALNQSILQHSATAEWGTNQKLSSLSGSNYMDTPVTSDGTTELFIPDFSWNSTEGYSIGWSHGHPGDDAGSPSPDDVFVMMDNLTDPELMSAGAAGIKFYKDNVSSTVITKNKNYIVTVKDWGKLGALYARFADDAGGFDDDWATIATEHQESYPAQGEGAAGIYALIKTFGSAINIYEAAPNTNTYFPVNIASNDLILPITCP